MGIQGSSASAPIDFKKADDSVRRVVLYNILIEFGVPMKLITLIKMCLNETCSRVRVGTNLSDMFPITNGLKEGEVLLSLFSNSALYQCFSTFVRPRTGKFFFPKTRARSQQIYS